MHPASAKRRTKPYPSRCGQQTSREQQRVRLCTQTPTAPSTFTGRLGAGMTVDRDLLLQYSCSARGPCYGASRPLSLRQNHQMRRLPYRIRTNPGTELLPSPSAGRRSNPPRRQRAIRQLSHRGKRRIPARPPDSIRHQWRRAFPDHTPLSRAPGWTFSDGAQVPWGVDRRIARRGDVQQTPRRIKLRYEIGF